ncbi:MAG: ATP-grasp domain-containing protein [Desulfobacterales bacterium]|jgi:carbamoyl-phosphate synthase large subunit|nr:ATP-grasp domain-containing protein [Desulfobacterales bacterium]MDP6808723.1 ATP-grasp domain-containing protein [Desulfobacterales bacterium]|tara:strand:+ start:12125 stop:13180 length:1056 start_codon:yes stop_codon:yes gene_type:complete
MKEKLTLFVTCAGGSLMPCVFIELMNSRLFDYRFVGVDVAPSVAAKRLLSEFHQMPAGDDPGYIPKLMDIVAREKVDMILPLSDGEAYAVSGALEEIEALGTRALVSPRECLDLISDKRLTYQNLDKAGIRVPEYSAVQDTNGLVAALDHYDYPNQTIVIKPTKGRGNRGLHILCGKDNPPEWLGSGNREKRIERVIDDPKQLASFMEGETLVMPCLGLPAYDVDVLNYGAEKYAVYVRERTNPTGIPYEGNILTVKRTITDYCRDVANALHLHALHDMDLMTDKNGKIVILEVNPRPSGSIASTLVSGFPILDWAVAYSLNREFSVIEPETDIAVSVLSCVLAVPSVDTI